MRWVRDYVPQPEQTRLYRTAMMGVIGLGVGVGILGIAPATSFWMALVGFALVGLMMPMANGPLQAIMVMISA